MGNFIMCIKLQSRRFTQLARSKCVTLWKVSYSDSWKTQSKIVLCSSIATVMTWVGWERKGCMFGLWLNTIGSNKFWALTSKSIGAKRWIEDPIFYICNQLFAVASILFWPVACSLFLIVFSGTSAVHMAQWPTCLTALWLSV